MTSILPALVIFGLEGTLFPFLITHDIARPFRLNENGEIVNSNDVIFNPYPEVLDILEKLKRADIKMAVTTDSNSLFGGATDIINLLGWNEYIPYTELHSENDAEHLYNMQNKTNIPFDKMIYFANWLSCVNEAQDLGIYSVYVEPPTGMTMKILDDAFREYELRQQKKKTK